jgi:predicted metal-dependent HD superfamily phosphohydrolase
VAALISWWTLDVRTLAPESHDDAVARTGADLLARWCEPARRYHGTTHLVEMFWALEELEAAGEIDDRQACVARLAAWFHDAVYDARALPGANEADSAAYAAASLRRLGLPAHQVRVVEDLVRMTDGHSTPAEDAVTAAFHDADLWILTAPQERFDAYCAQVREEYAFVQDDAYRAGRSAILQPFADRETVYRTRHARQEWDEPARSNLARELARLRADPAGRPVSGAGRPAR